MVEKPKSHDVVVQAKDGDVEALVYLLSSLTPVVKRYSRWSSRPVDCYSDLVIWLLKAVHQYPN